MTNQAKHVERRGFMAWSTRDILITSAVGVIFGLLQIVLQYAFITIMALGPVVQWAWNGLWFLAPLFLAYVVRRPGAAFLVTLLSALVNVPFTPTGVANIISGLLYGTCAEVSILLATRYRTWSMPRLVIAGMLGGAFLFGLTGAPFGIFNLAPSLIAGVFIVTLISCGAAAVVAKLLADAVVHTGVLSGTAIGQAGVEEV